MLLFEVKRSISDKENLGQRWMGVIFSILIIGIYAVGYNMLASYNVQSTFSVFRFYKAGVTPAIFGGFSGSCIMYGVKRGLYSNEAGMGSAPNASANADVAHPASQGLVQMISVFIDTLVICSATALMCLSTNVAPAADMAGAPFVQAAMQDALGTFGPIFIAVSLSLFAFTTLIGNYSYCEGCLEFILHRKIRKTELLAFRILASILVFVGAVASAELVWDTADLLQGLIVVVNMPAILLLSGRAARCLKDYIRQRETTEKPVFRAKDIDLKEDVDFWK